MTLTMNSSVVIQRKATESNFLYVDSSILWFPYVKHESIVCHDELIHTHGSVTRYEKLKVGHAMGMPGMFYPPPISQETAS